ncbi:glucoamylase family protein, partial [Fulvivirga aurantia]|uniref:glucoamylase family protein n=1 Tax=Fulvivirga aurantia TaxID=2529383 RepID=UPI003CCE0BAD
RNLLYAILVGLTFSMMSCGDSADKKSSATQENKSEISEDSLLTKLQYQTFQYFWEGAEPNSGMARERIHMDDIYPSNDRNVVTSGGSGFGVMAILVGIERGFIKREAAVERYEKILNFLETADRFHGVYPHRWYGDTGKVKPFSKKDDGGDLVETAFLMQGLLAVREYFKEGNEREKSIASRIDKIWREVEWDWHTKGGEDVLYWHWSPNYGWEMNFPVGGYNECLIMYVLAASSPTHPIEPEVYHKGWALDGKIETDQTYYDYDLVLNHYEHDEAKVGPLFWAHYSYLGLNPKGLKDQYGEYWTLNQNHAKIHYAYCVENLKGYKGYGEKAWGLTSSYSMKGYSGHRPDKDLGVISPTAALSSFPYTPEESMTMLQYLYNDADSLVGEYGPYDAFNLTNGWYLPRYLAIDQGPIPVMIENHRSGLIWDLFMQAPEVKEGLDKLGFSYE